MITIIVPHQSETVKKRKIGHYTGAWPLHTKKKRFPDSEETNQEKNKRTVQGNEQIRSKHTTEMKFFEEKQKHYTATIKVSEVKKAYSIETSSPVTSRPPDGCTEKRNKENNRKKPTLTKMWAKMNLYSRGKNLLIRKTKMTNNKKKRW